MICNHKVVCCTICNLAGVVHAPMSGRCNNHELAVPSHWTSSSPLSDACTVHAQVHCVKAGTQLLKLAREQGPFPAGLVLHSFLGPADLVKPFAGIEGCYFSISGHSLRSPKKAPSMISQVTDQQPCSTSSPAASC